MFLKTLAKFKCKMNIYVPPGEGRKDQPIAWIRTGGAEEVSAETWKRKRA